MIQPMAIKRSCSKAPFFSTKQTSNSNITTSSDLTISLDNNTATKIVQNQSLVSLSKTKLPWKTSIFDTSPSRGTSTTIVTRDQDVIGLGLGDTRSNDTDTNLGNELDRDARSRVGALQIVDQLLEILDGVDVVVRRRRDETDTRGGVTGAGNGTRDLVARQLTTFTRLSTLSHLDLQLIGIGEVVGGTPNRPEAICLMAERMVSPFSMRQAALGIFTTFTSVGLAAESVHGNSESGVRLHGDGTVGHGTSDESADNLSPWLDLVDGDRSCASSKSKSSRPRSVQFLICSYSDME